MRRFLVRGGGGGLAIDLYEHEPGRIILLLGDLKPRHARFLQTGARICQRRLLEGLDAFWFDMNMNVNNEHGKRICDTVENLKRYDCACSGTVWWRKAADEPPPLRFGAPRPAREDARPTEGSKLNFVQ